MPLVRYFSFVSGVLLALLFILDACFPKLPVATKAKVNLPGIRIYSDPKWPERIVYDTNPPAIVPTSMASTEGIIQAPKIIADASTGAKERESFAMLPPSKERLQASNTKVTRTKAAIPKQNRQETLAGAQGRDGTPPAIWLVWRKLLVRAAVLPSSRA